ncbi:2-amino-4-hydroxy-6-hydroxymethyldihydropteridine diphosphokinase [Aestuariibacter halophilus]|uniref:2-amino-4-hydroxy-6-hydroxymethyldihydropteridine pyrophosphokinase n=1 Tax=Fluctibacter halophilus TaxID=226011 RepID=A0ABS8GBN7_9ALTE|nr:2-amino-4-hydroxy-6-hydroxymethyldihydropteridine diphosphokinase [Aestuariibacter halophilus]MCC2617154.1 2-amino-4-hydroxy-6-hydroxymethyldihydropteridine diphosphokinase [Aestuariibacter halophilus]
MTSTTVYIGLGSNLSEPARQLADALAAMAALPQTQVAATSSLYASRPMGPQDQPDYVNAVCALETTLAAEDLLDALQHIEQQQGRVRKDQRWGARTLDLDILLFGEQCIDTPRLTVPHYGLREREFVLCPLAEIAPQLILPGGDRLQSVLNNCPMNGLKKLSDRAVEISCDQQQP